MYNRMANVKNKYQGDTKKVLCICSAGLLRSPTAAEVLSQEPFNYNTRSCGVDSEFALIPLDEVLLEWADELVFMTEEQSDKVISLKQRVILNIPDIYRFRDKELVELIKQKYLNYLKERVEDEIERYGR